MHFSIKATVVYLIAVLPTVNSYIVAFFKEQGCDPADWGSECGDVDDFTCCEAPEGQLYVSVGHDANWGYSLQGGDSCGVIISNGDGCVSIDSGLESISGGSVVGIANRKRSEPPKVAKADTFFYLNGTEKYTLPIDSDDGRLFESIKDREEQRNFITSYGKFTQLDD